MQRLLLLLPTSTYRAAAFIGAARRLELDLVVGSERSHPFQERRSGGFLSFDFLRLDLALREVRAAAAVRPFDAIVGVDDASTELATRLSEALALPHNPVAAAAAARDKYKMRRIWDEHDVPIPRFALRSFEDDLVREAARTVFPCVVKPLTLSASRGVMRANDERQFLGAVRRLEAILRSPDLAQEGEASRHLLVESFVPGREVALEGLLSQGRLHVLALFDKPDPLDGPFFEETIYVTPSRLPTAEQSSIAACAAHAAAAMGLADGPVHAELRVGPDGPRVIELAARSIGGLCSRTLQFGTGLSLEELILRQALRLPIPTFERAGGATGVMMLPVPRAGVLREVRGIERALDVPGIEDVAITVHPDQDLVPLPEGSSYPGFLFADGETPRAVESSLREAHRRLEFLLAPPRASVV